MADYRIQIGTQLDTKGIDAGINKYHQKKTIEFKSRLDTSGIDNKLANYKAKKPIEVNTKLNTSGLAKKIGEYKPKTPIVLNAKLNTKNIDAAISGYKAKKAIEVNIRLNHQGISEQLRNYKPKGAIKVNTKLDNADISKQIREYSSKTPIKLSAKLNSANIDEAIRKYKPTKIKLDVRLNKGAINEEIANFKPKNTIRLKAALQKGAISQEIRDYKPSTPIKVSLQLDPTDINNKIDAYKSKSPVEITAKLKLNVKDIREQLMKYRLIVPVNLNVANLDTKDIDEKIRSYKTNVPIKVGVKLDGKDINGQIGAYRPSTPINVNAKLDVSNINADIALFQPTATLGVKPDLILENVDDQIRAYIPKAKIKVNVDLNDSNINAQTGSKKAHSSITVNAKLDFEKINEQIRNFKTASPIMLSVQLDRNSINQGIQNIQANTPIRINVELDQNSVQNVQNQINALRQQIQQLGNIRINLGGGNGARQADDVVRAYRELISLQDRLGSKQERVAKLDTSHNQREILELSNQIDDLIRRYQSLYQLFNGQFNDAQIDRLNRKFQITSENLEIVNRKVADARANFASDIQARVDTGAVNNQISALEAKFNSLRTRTTEVTNGMNSLRTASNDLNAAINSGNVDNIINAYERYKTVLQDVTNQIDIQKRAEQQAADQQKLVQQKANLSLDMSSWLKNNSAAAKQFGERIKQLQSELKTCDSTRLSGIRSEFQGIKKEAELAGKAGLTFGDRIKNQLSKYSTYLSGYMIFMYAIRGLRSMFQQVKAIDSAMTELKKVTDETDASYNQFLKNAASKAREIGTTIDGLVSSTADFARLGYDFVDAQGLAEVANIYAVVGDEIEGVEQATESLISTMAAFKDETSKISNTDFAMDIIDKFNEVGNNFAISSGGIGEALEKSASSMRAANNTLDETIALVTAANTVVQNPDVVGTAFKTLSMRIRGATTELEEAGLETDGMVTSTAKLREEILALSGVDIMENDTTFKSTYKILDELSQKWKYLSDIQQATITELIAGKRQGNIVSSLMNNFQTARDALEVSLNSSGSAMKEHEKWQQSLEAQINNLKAAWQGLSQSFLKSDFLKSFISFITRLLDGITKLVDKIGVLPTLIGAFFGYKAISSVVKNWSTLLRVFSMFGRLKAKGLLNFTNILRTLNVLFPKTTGLVKKFASVLKGGIGSSNGFGKSLKGIFDALKQHWIIAIVVAAVTVLTAVFGYQSKQAEKLAKKVDELTEKYKEQHEELKKLQGDYDDSNESSMISKYERLSRGVDNLGRNVSLTADEYSEYQDIVNKIAEQFPSLVSGYDEQGNALLTCKGNVEELVEAYEKLIHTQNQEILTNTGDIEDNFENTLKKTGGRNWWSNGHGFWAGFFKNIASLAPRSSIFGDIANDTISSLFNYELRTDTVKNIEKLLNTTDENEREKIYRELEIDRFSEEEIRDMLSSAGFETGIFKDPLKGLEKAIEEDPAKIREVVNNYYASFAEAIEKQKTIARAKLSEAFDISSVISGLDYGNISEDLQAIAYQTINSLDYDFFENLNEQGKTVEQWTTEMLNQLNSISKADNAEIEAAFKLQTQFNGGDISYGEYVNGLRDVQSTIDGLNLAGEVKEQFEISLGLDENGIVDQYDALVNRLTDSENYDFDISKSEAQKILNGLSSEEYSIAVDVITDLSNNDYKENAEEVENAIQRELSKLGLSLDLDIEVEKAGLEAAATAITESFSGSGLSTESISAIEGMFRSLNGYDPSKLFERTANGIRLNSEEYRRLNSEYNKNNIAKVNKEIDALGDIYNQTREELYRLTYGTDEYNLKAAELSGIEEQIKDLEQLAASYKGLTSAYQEWQTAESAGSQRDMYESLIEGLENIDDEISRGWYDDGTIQFLELLTGEDLSTAGIEKQKEAYKRLGEEIENTSYSVRDFFTVDEDGNSTNTGVYNFLDAIGQLEEEKFGGKDVIKRNDKGNIIGFDFQIVGGDKVIAEALGISEELVQIMVRAADDAGFVVSMDGTYQQLNVLKEKAQEAAESLNRILEKNGKNGFDFNFNSSNVEDIKKQLTEAQNILDTFRNTDGTINTELEGADEALTVASTLQSMLDKLTRPTYMNIETSQVEDEIQEPLRNLQELRRLTETEHQLKLSGADTSKLEESKQEVYEYFENLDPEVKATLGLVDDSGKPLTGQALKDKLSSGDIAIEATIDIQLEMDEKLGILVDKALLDAGIIDDEEFEKRVDVYLNADVDNEDAKNKTEQAVNEVAGNNGVANGESSDKKVDTNVDVEVKADEVDTSDVKDKTEEAVKNGSIENVAVETKVELETTIGEALDLIDRLEDKDITIDVTVKGLDDIIELNKGLDIDGKVSGNIDNLSKYVESAKALSEIDENIESKITASIYGNVATDGGLDEYEINNLKTYIESANGIKDLEGEISSKITANVKGNVFDEFEYEINNLKTYVESANGIKDLEGEIKSKITANIAGNVFDDFEYEINNLKTYIESADGIKDLEGHIESKITADIDGNVATGNGNSLYEYQINNLKTYVESAEGIKDLEGHIKSKITADVDGSVFDENEYVINNLKTYIESAEGIKDLEGEIKSKIIADIDGNVATDGGLDEYVINNLKTYIESAEGIKDLEGHIESKITADVDGNVATDGGLDEYEINNLKTYVESAEGIKDLEGHIESKITADIDGSVFDDFEYEINNLKTYVESAKGIKDLEGEISSKITADVAGNVATDGGLDEYEINNLKTYVESAKGINDIKGDINSKITADVAGNVFDENEYVINNLKTYVESAKGINDIKGDISSKITADVAGNVFDKDEYEINNLKTYIESAHGINDIKGDINSKITADVAGNVFDKNESTINNLGVYVESAKGINDIKGDISSKITADVAGNVFDKDEYEINNLGIYIESADGINDIKGDISSKITANVAGNVFDKNEGTIDNLKVFVESAEGIKDLEGDLTSNVTANIEGNVFTEGEDKIDNLDTFVESAEGFRNEDLTSNVTANIEGNAISATDATNRISSLSEFKSLVEGMSSQTIAINVTANVDSANIERAITLLTDVSNSGVFKDYNATVKVDSEIVTIDDTVVQNYNAPKKEGEVSYSVDPESAVYTWSAPSKDGIVNYSASVEALTDAQKHKTGTITYKANIIGLGGASGTAYANGSSGRAFVRGNWGIKGNGVALGGELGRELVVRDGKFFTIGDSGAEFFRYKKNDIVFNASQTESLFKYGGIKGANPRGKMLASGTAFANGNAFPQGSEGTGGSGSAGGNSVTGQSYGANSSSSSSDKEFEEVIDWIEVIIDRIERAIDKFDQQANNIYKSWSSRNKALISEISKVQDEIILQQRAYNKYIEAANGVGLSSSWAEKVRNGEIDIETIKDEALKEKIDDYQNWYEKALDCQDAIEELKEQEASLFAQRVENVSTQYEGILGVIEHEKNMLEEYISQTEAQGHLVSANYYEALASNEESNLAKLKQEKADMLSELQSAMESGTIDKYSESW